MAPKDEPQPQYFIEPFDEKRHRRSNFSCGDKSLDCYLKKQANQDLKRKVAVPFVLVEPCKPDVLGYYTLSSFSVRLNKLPSTIKKKLPRYPKIPATLIGRLAVDREYQGKGLGERLLMDALYNSWEKSKKIASFSVIVEAPNENTREFYLNYGFKSFPDGEDRLFLPMKTVEQIF